MRTSACIAAFFACTTAFAAGTAAAAEKFPSRPITIINPFTAGGPVDLQLRLIAAQGEKIFGVPIVIDVKPGASATLGPATMVATAKPDGYTMSNLSVAIYSLPWMQKVAFDPTKDFTYIIHMAGYRAHVAVRKDAPWQNWKAFAADAKSRPGQISYASTGAGGVPHLTMESIILSAGIKLLHVPFRGNSEVITALLGGHVMATASAGTMIPLIEAGETRSLLSVSAKRNPRFPNVPSLEDEGISAEIDLAFPFGIGGPKGMDPAVVKVLHDGLKRAFDSPENVALMKQLDLDPRYLPSDAYRAFAMRQIEGYRKLVDTLGLAAKPN